MKTFLEVIRGWAVIVALGFGWAPRAAGDAESETLYFLILGLEQPRTTWVVGLRDPEQIAYVRAVLRGDADKAMAIVPPRRYPEEGEPLSEIWPADRLRPPRPLYRADGINRNYFAPSTPAWSWHIDEVAQLAFGCLNCFVLEPQEIEAAILANPDQPISWNTVVYVPFNPLMELGPASSLRFLEHEGQEYVIWVGLGLGYMYTLEATDDPVRGEWAPVPGGDWPLDVVRWPIDRSEPGSRFYRVRAEPVADPGAVEDG